MLYVLWAKHIKDAYWVDITDPSPRAYCVVKKLLEEDKDHNNDWEYKIVIEDCDANSIEPDE